MDQKIKADRPLNVLYLEDSPQDFEIVYKLLINSGYDLHMDRVETEKEFTSVLNTQEYDIILADFKLPGFDALGALRWSIDICPDVPFICVSGSIGEETAIELIKQGAVDYVFKNRPDRLPFSVQRALGEASEKRARRRAEISFQKSEQKYRSIFENAVEGIFQTVPEGRFITVNPAMAHMHGFASPEEMIEGITDIGMQLYVNPEDRLRYRAILEEKGVANNFEAQVYRKDGNTIWTSTNARVIKDAAGNISRFEGTVENITERRQAEENYRTMFREMLNGFALHDILCDDKGSPVDYRFLAVNPAFERMTGFKAEELVGRTVLEALPGTERYWIDVYGKVALTGEPVFFENYAVELDKYFEVTAFRPAPNQFACIFADITSRKLAEDELKRTMEKLRKSLVGTIHAMSLTVETRDPYTSGHQTRVSNLARVIAQEMGLPNDTVDTIRMAGTIHDIGKISIPAEILSKPGKLTDIEFSLIKVHPQSGYDIIKDTELPHPVAEIVLQHHERLDGSGYPLGLKGEQILLESRIISVADVVEAMASYRPYRPALGMDVALEEIEKSKGILYDEKVVDVCLKLFREKGFSFEPTAS